jgi:NTE family protein
MTTAFVLSGGGTLGALQVGMLRALACHDIVPDLIVGTSVGAINGAFFAGAPTQARVDELETIWRTLRSADVFPINPRAALRGMLGRSDHIVPPFRLGGLIRRHLGYERLEEARIPMHVVTTEVRTGEEVVLSTGNAVQALLASAAIPGVFPPVRIDGRVLMDGSVIDNTPIGCAIELGADAVYVLSTAYRTTVVDPRRSTLGTALHAFGVLSEQRLWSEVARFGQVAELEVIPPPATVKQYPVGFGNTAQLIEAAERATTHWLQTRRTRSGTALPTLHSRSASPTPAA